MITKEQEATFEIVKELGINIDSLDGLTGYLLGLSLEEKDGLVKKLRIKCSI